MLKRIPVIINQIPKNQIVRGLHDRKLPSVIYNVKCRHSKLVGTESPKKADYCKNIKNSSKNKKEIKNK